MKTETFYWRKRKIHNLHFHPLSFYALVWSECEKQKQFLLWGSDTGTHLLSAQLWWDGGGTEIYFLFCFCPLIQYPSPLGECIREELSQQPGAHPEGDPRRTLLCWCSALGGQEIQTEVSADPDGGKGAPALHMDLQQLQEATVSFWWFFPHSAEQLSDRVRKLKQRNDVWACQYPESERKTDFAAS